MTKKITLRFDPEQSLNPEGKHVRDGLSTVLRTGDNLWVSCDERTTIERLTLNSDGSFGDHKSFNLKNYLDLPDGDNSEIDIEGLGMANHYIWVVGSHSLKRKKPRSRDSIKKQIKRLATVQADPNRYLLARIPILLDKTSGQYVLHKECENPDRVGQRLWAAQLEGNRTRNMLMDVLQQDEHISPFLPIPGKDNGFDIEGLAISGKRIFIGLRGPVLRGWAIVLEVEIEEGENGKLYLKQLTNERVYKKHFLHMRGKGIRELHIAGDDMYILAGPTMDLDGVIAIYRWPNAVGQTQEETVVHASGLERLCEVPHGTGANTGKDKAEGLAIYDETHVLIVFDSPVDARKTDDNTVLADIIQVIK